MIDDYIVADFEFIIDMDNAMSNLVQHCKLYLYLFVPISLQTENIGIWIYVRHA